MNDRQNGSEQQAKNVLGGELKPCSYDPKTGFFRDGYCHTGPTDRGTHVVCARVTTEFLEYSAAQGNDLMTPQPQYNFSGLSEGDQWCLCASRWKEAEEAGKACPVVLEATHEKATELIPLETLKKYAISKDK